MRKALGSAIILLAVVFGGVFSPFSLALAQGNPSATVDTTDYNDYESRLQDCELLKGKFAACLVEGIYYIVLIPSAWFARTAGEIFDYFIQYSLDTNSYRGHGNFIERGWSIIRDIANVLFIFSLLYIAIKTILDGSTSAMKTFLVQLIISALLINFSLFFCRIIIDAGNIVARAFYNNIEIPNDDNLEYHTISQGIVMHVNPQRILGTELFNPRHSVSTPDNPIPAGKVDNGYAATILIMACAVNITLGITFLSVALLFVGRVVGLWFLMIFSPIALASRAVPKNIFGKFNWDSWLSQTLSLSFMAPVFVFFLFLLIMFLQVIFKTNVADDSKSTTQLLMAVMIPFAMVIFILNMAKKVAGEMAGEAGQAVKSIVGKAAGYGLAATGLAAGGLIGATAFAGRNVIGAVASGTLQQGKFQERVRLNNIRASSYDKKAQQEKDKDKKKEYERQAAKARAAASRNAIMVKQLDNARKGSYDMRKTGLMQQASKGTNYALSNVGSFMTGSNLSLNLGKAKDTNRLKYEQDKVKKAEKERQETAKLYENSPTSDLAVLKYAANRGLAGQDEFVRRSTIFADSLEKKFDKYKDRKDLSESEKAEMVRLKSELDQMRGWQKAAEGAKTDEEMASLVSGRKAEEVVRPEVERLEKDFGALQEKQKKFEEKKAGGEQLSMSEEIESRRLAGEMQKLRQSIDADVAANGGRTIKQAGFTGIKAVEDAQGKENKNAYAGVVRDNTANPAYPFFNQGKGFNLYNNLGLNISIGDREQARIADKLRAATKSKDAEATDHIKKAMEALGVKAGDEDQKKDDKPKDEPKKEEPKA